jgi:hypothetical protein
MLKTAVDEAKTFAMIMRLVGFAMMWIGLYMCLAPFPVVLDVLPFLGGVGRVAIGGVTFVVSAVLSITTIVVAMIAHNPIALAVVIVALVAGTVWLVRRKTADRAMAQAVRGQNRPAQDFRKAA